MLRNYVAKFRWTDCEPCTGKDCPEKDGTAWSPTDIPDGARKLDANVRLVTLAVFDLEGDKHTPLPDQVLTDLGKRLRQHTYAVHSTHGGRGFYRLLLPMTRPVTPEEWPRVWAGLIERFQLPADTKCGNPARIYYLPSAPRGSETIATSNEGVIVDPDEFLAESVPTAPDAPRATETRTASLLPISEGPPPETKGPEKIDVGAVRDALKNCRGLKSSPIRETLLTGAPLAVVGGRDDALVRAMATIATAAAADTPTAAAVAVAEPSIRAMDCEPEGVQHWLDLAAEKFERAQQRRIQKDTEDRKQHLDLFGLTEEIFNTPSPLITPDGPTPQTAWADELIFLKTKDGNFSTPKSCEFNGQLVLMHDPYWANTLRWNDVTKEIEITGGPLAKVDPGDREIFVQSWFQKSKYKIDLTRETIGALMLYVARQNRYDPLANYLAAAKWDGTKRLEGLFRTYFGATNDPAYLADIGPRWMISCVARALQPGCKVDTVLILQGEQGKKKSTACFALSSPWFSDSEIDVHDKDSKELAGKRWFIELGELTTLSKHDVESLKRFLSQRADEFRPPYGRKNEVFQRRCIFIGTGNRDEFLKDTTGARRFWPITCDAIDLEAIQRDRDQLWAEAVVRYHRGEAWWFDAGTPEALRQAQAANNYQEAPEHEEYTEAISRWWYRLPPEKRPESITAYDVAREALDNMPLSQMPRESVRIGRSLRDLGFKKKRIRRGERLVWSYEPSEHLRTAQGPVTPKLSVA